MSKPGIFILADLMGGRTIVVGETFSIGVIPHTGTGNSGLFGNKNHRIGEAGNLFQIRFWSARVRVNRPD